MRPTAEFNLDPEGGGCHEAYQVHDASHPRTLKTLHPHSCDTGSGRDPFPPGIVVSLP